MATRERPEQAETPTRWGTVFVAVSLGVVAALHIGKVPPALPSIRADLSLGLVGGGFVVSTFNLLGMLLGLTMGGVADRLGRRRTATLGFAFLVAGGLLGAVATGLPGLLASRALEGLGFIAVAVTMPGIVAEAASTRDRPLALGLWSIFTPMGFALALLATPPVLAAFGWRAVWVGLAGLALVAAVVAIARLPMTPPGPVAGFGKRLGAVLARRRMWFLSLTFGTYAFQWVTLMAWLPTYLIGVLGFSLAAAAGITALVVVLNVPGNVLGGVLMRAGVGAGRLVALGSVVMAVTATGLFLGEALGPVVGIGLCLVFSLFGGLIPAVLFAQIPGASPSPAHAGQANGMLLQGSATGQFLGPPLIGAAVAAAGGLWTGAILPLVLAAALTLVLGALGARPRETGGMESRGVR